MEKAFVFLATGFEEMEAIGTADVLRRAGIQAATVSITGNKTVVGAHGIPVCADYLFEEAPLAGAAALVLPGGLPGAHNLNAHEPLKEALLQQYRDGRIVAAICAAPLVFGWIRSHEGSPRNVLPWLRRGSDWRHDLRRERGNGRERHYRQRSRSRIRFRPRARPGHQG